MKPILIAMLTLMNLVAWGDSSCPESSSEAVQETFCSEVASGLRIKLHALKILRKYAKVDNKEAIHYLESQAGADRISLSQFSGAKACQTKNVNSVTDEADTYWQAYELK